MVFSKFLKSAFLKLLALNLFLALVACVITRPTPSRAKRFAEKRAKRYFDEGSLRDEIKMLKMGDMCPNGERYFGTDLDFYSCDLGKTWGLYGKTALIVRKQPTSNRRCGWKKEGDYLERISFFVETPCLGSLTVGSWRRILKALRALADLFNTDSTTPPFLLANSSL